MKPHALSQQAVVLRPHRHTDSGLVRYMTDRFLLLPLGAAIALVWANTASESYYRVAQALAFPVNEILMALFLGLITHEVVEAVMPGGALHTWRRWTLPVVAAAGGLLGAAFVYLTYVSLAHQALLLPAWPIAGAIDIAAGYYVLKIVFRRGSALPFLLVVGIATNAAGLIVLSLWPAFTRDHIPGAVLLTAGVVVAAILRRAKVHAFWPYLAFAGGLSWAGFYQAGVPAALALVPIVLFLPHRPRPLDLFADQPDDDTVHHAEHEWNMAVQVVLFLFGLVNAGVLMREYYTGTWAVMSAALIGRPLGMLGAIWIAQAAGLHLPRRLGWRELTVVALATSSGFTFALFAAAALLPPGPILAQVKIGALATVLGAVAALATARLLQVGTFAHRADEAANIRI